MKENQVDFLVLNGAKTIITKRFWYEEFRIII